MQDAKECVLCHWRGKSRYFRRSQKEFREARGKKENLVAPEGVNLDDVCNFCKKTSLRVA